MNLQSLQWTTNVTEITWYRKLIPVKKISLGGTLTWQTFVLADCNREVKADVKTSYWNKLMRVQNGVLENESISSSCQVWCLTTREWVNNHCYFVSFEHSVSLQVLHSHIVTDLASSSWGEFEVFFGGGNPPQMCLDKTLCRGHDGMWPPNLRSSRSTGRRVMAFRIFSNMAAIRHFEF